MTIHRFSIEVSGLDLNEEGIESRFYGNGVDDALITISGERCVLAFDREAEDAASGLESAARDIAARGCGVVRIEWDEPRCF